MGSGLASSSTLVVAEVEAFPQRPNVPMGAHHVARQAFDIEPIGAGFARGPQDEYAAALAV
jgi:galactokinase/mevalonate kinase-like predicted kinase